MTDGPPVASCLICGVLAPQTVWYRSTNHGACESCRTAPAALAACHQEREMFQLQRNGNNILD